MKNQINKGSRSEALNEVKPDRKINKNLQSFLKISSVQKEVLSSHKLKDYANGQENLFKLKEDKPSQKNARIT